jgi:hypothetical protein
VFENGALRRIFGPKRDEIMGVWRKLHNEELRNVYSSSRIIRMMKSRRIRRVGRVARMERRRKRRRRRHRRRRRRRRRILDIGGRARREETTRKTET